MIGFSKVTFYCRPKDKEGVFHAFPVDSAASHETAKNWATVYNWENKSKPTTEPEVFEFENTGFDNIQIKSLDIRGNGGRAYQVTLEMEGKKFKVDLRENTLLDVINTKGIQAGGRLNGTFCFAKEGSQTTLILEGSKQHKHALNAQYERETYSKTISRKDLKPGHSYTTISGDSKIFIGFVYAANLNKDDGKLTNVKKQMLFIKDDPDYINFANIKDSGDKGIYRWELKVVDSHSFRIEGDKKLEITPDVFDRIIAFGEKSYAEIMTRDRYSSYLSDYFEPYKIAKMRVNKKDTDFKQEDVDKMVNKAYEYTRSWRY